MANISSYPTATPVSGDLILGTQLSATSVNKTRNFTAGSVTSAGLGYTSLVQLLTQTGTNAPVATEVYDNTGQTFTWARTTTGIYTLTASAATFTANKTIVFFNNGNAAPNTNKWTRTSDTVLTLTIGIDNALTNGSFEVRIYV
tara:strand:- start:2153 stop:2584 length:432 start_codon:yes stop_codon:yes gene_type:complete